jgi:hypothetical protein
MNLIGTPIKHLVFAITASAALSNTCMAAGPAGVTDAALWLDAAQLTGLSSGATVTTWADMSGSGNHATLASGAPTYQTNAVNGKPVVRIQGYQINAPGGSFGFPRISNIRTAFWVIRKSPWSHQRFLLGDDTEYHFHAGVRTLWDAENTSPYILGGTTKIMGATVNGTTAPLPEGSYQIISVVTSGDVQANTLSQDRSFTERTWEGDIAEVLLYPRALTPTEEAAVGAALANKYGLITSYLPATFLSFGTNVVGSSATIALPVSGAAAITWTVPFGTNLAGLAPSFTLSSGTCNRNSGAVPSPNFGSGPVTYAVTSGGTTNTYTVTAVTAPPGTACEIKTFNANLTGIRSTVMPTGTVVVNVPAGTTETQLAALTPTLTLSPGATCAIPNPPLSSTAPVHYIVTAQDGVTTRDYTVTTPSTEGAFRLFVVKTTTTGLTADDYHYLGLIPTSKHLNHGVPAVFSVANASDFTNNIYLQDYLRRYNPAAVDTVNFSATLPNFASSTITATGPLELSASLATSHWTSSGTVVLVSDAVNATNYPNVLQASALASALDAPLLYYNSTKETLVQSAITQLGATEVIYINSVGTKPAMATRVLANPAAVVGYLAEKSITTQYFAATNPTDTALISGAKLSLTAPFLAARRGGIVVPITGFTANQLVHFPTNAPAINSQFQQLYQTIGRYPDYLALVGNAASIPLRYTRPDNGVAGEIYNAPTDFEYSNADADPFPDIAIGRVMAYDIFDATLLTCRISSYDQLFDGTWETTMADVGGAWDSAFKVSLMENYGFHHLNLMGADLAATRQPVEASVIGHNDHSAQLTLGGAFDTDTLNIMAPVFIGSEGCATAAIDFETIDDSQGGDNLTDRGYGLLVVNRLFKLGAVAFLGGTRSVCGADVPMKSAAFNAMLAGEPIGRCYIAGVSVHSMDWVDSFNQDQRRNYILLGDPALTIHVPKAPVVAPAAHAVTAVDPTTDMLQVNIPSTLFTPEVDRAWCDLWSLTYPQRWGEKPGLYGSDVDRYYLVRHTTTRPVVNVEELDAWPTVNAWNWGPIKLGMMAAPTVDVRQDGTTQLVWSVRANIMNWAGTGGGAVPLAQMTNASFRITYLPDTTLPTLNSSSIIDDKSAGPVTVNTPVIYTLSFSEDMDDSTVSAADFGNAGTAAITIGTVTETSPGVFTVTVTPTSAGTLQLKVNQSAVLNDLSGNNLGTNSPIADDTTMTVRTPYAAWAGDTEFGGDSNHDGVTDGLAWLLGAANPSANASALLPVPNHEADKLVLIFRCLKTANRGAAVLGIQFAEDLGHADPGTIHEVIVPDADGTIGSVAFDTTPDADPAFINVRAEISASSGKLFGRLYSTEN